MPVLKFHLKIKVSYLATCIRVHLSVFWPLGSVSAILEPRVIPGSHDLAIRPRSTRIALSGQLCLPHDMSLETNGASCFRKIVSTIRPVRTLGHLVEDGDVAAHSGVVECVPCHAATSTEDKARRGGS
jgi:hypothetical protein